MLHMLKLAAKVALSKTPELDKRNFILGCIGIRTDGAQVSAKNGAVIASCYDDYRLISDAHCEMRVLSRLGRGGIIYVARVLKKDGSLAMSRPCGTCRMRLSAAKVNEVYFTVNNYQYGRWLPAEDTDKIYTCP